MVSYQCSIMQFFIKKGEIVNHRIVKILLILCINPFVAHAAAPSSSREQELLRRAREQCAKDPNFQKLKSYPMQDVRKALADNPIVPTATPAPSKPLAAYDKILREADPELLRQAKEMLNNNPEYQAKIKSTCDDLWIIMIQDPRAWQLIQQDEKALKRVAPLLNVRAQGLAGSPIPTSPMLIPTAVTTAQSAPTAPQRPILRAQNHAIHTRPATARTPMIVPQQKKSQGTQPLSEWDIVPEHQKPNITKAIGLKVLTADMQRKKKRD